MGVVFGEVSVTPSRMINSDVFTGFNFGCVLLRGSHASRLDQSLRPANKRSLGPVGPVMMGRAAAVRAQTKGKTDAAKAKVNAR